MTRLPHLGVGVGWRPEIAGVVADLPDLRFCEVVAEGLHTHVPLSGPLATLRERGVTLVPHGVRLSLGGAEPVAPERVRHLAECAALLEAPLASEHIAFVRSGDVEAGHLLPVPRTRAGLDALASNYARTVDGLDGVPLALEPIAALFDWPDDKYDEADFLNALLDRTGAMLLLDVANVYANARNRAQDPIELLDRLPLDRIAYVHVAGGREHEGLYHDTHTDAVPPPVLDLVTALAERATPAGWLLERDGDHPPAEVLRSELTAITAAVDAGVAVR